MPQRYHRTQPWNWFFKRPAYVKFMVRELTAVFVAVYLIFLLVWLARLGAGKDSFAELLAAMTQPESRWLHAAALIAALWHSITWFNLTPKAMPVFCGENRVPDPLVAIGMGYLPWVVVSILILWGVYTG